MEVKLKIGSNFNTEAQSIALLLHECLFSAAMRDNDLVMYERRY